MSATWKRHRWWALGAVFLVLAGTLATYARLPRRYTASAGVWLDRRAEPELGSTRERPRRDLEIGVLTSPAAAADVAGALNSAGVRDVGRLDMVKVNAPGASRAVTVSYTASDPMVAASVVNRLVDRYVAFRSDDRGWAATLRRRQDDANAARGEMMRARSAASAYRAVMGADARRGEADRLARDLAALRAQLADPASGAATASLRAQREQLGAELTQLQQRYGPRYPEIIALTARIAALDAEIAAGTRRASALAGRAQAVQARAEEQLAESAEADGRADRLDMVASAAEDRYQALLDDVRRTEEARPVPGGAHVIARAAIPSTPEFPRPWPFAVGGMLAALVAGGAVAFLREARVPGFRTRAAAERRLGLPVIGMVPDASELPGAAASGTHPGDLVLSDRQSTFAAAFRSIHVGLGLGRGSDSPRSVAISSAVAAEGKTTVSIGLARSAALAGLRVLLIDCDMRLPAASRALAPQADAGLADVLGGKVEFKQALTRDAPSGVWVLSARPDGQAAAAGLIGSDAMERLLARVAGDYDLIVLDAAPALALAETAALARLADTVLLVARWRVTPVGATRLALDTLRDAGAKVSALALTRVFT